MSSTTPLRHLPCLRHRVHSAVIHLPYAVARPHHTHKCITDTDRSQHRHSSYHTATTTLAAKSKSKPTSDTTTQSDIAAAAPTTPADTDDPFAITDKQLAGLRVRLVDKKYEEPGIEYRQQCANNLYTTAPAHTHTAEQLGQFCNIPTDVLESIPQSLRAHTHSLYKSAGQYNMVRLPAHHASQHIRSFKPSSPQSDRLISITGERGVGKSFALLYCMQVARELGWLIIGTDAAEFPWERRGFITPNSEREDIFDQAAYTSVWMTDLCKHEQQRLEQIPLPSKLRQYNWHGNPINSEPRSKPIVTNPTNLYHLAQLAANDQTQSAAGLYDFMSIINTQTQVPVLIAIDSINMWDQQSAFVHPVTYKNIKPRQLALVDALQPFTHRPPTNGVTIMATTSTATQKYSRDYLEHTREYVVHHYTKTEAAKIVQHYAVSGYVYSNLEKELMNKLQGLSGNVGRELYLVSGTM